MTTPRFEIGDLIAYEGWDCVLFRLITEVRDTGYTWEYADRGAPWRADDCYLSENSSDPMLTAFRLVLKGARRP